MNKSFSELSGTDIICTACAQNCNLSKSKVGKCGVRILNNESLEILNYKRITALRIEILDEAFQGVDRKALSISSSGCTFKCAYCPDWDISHFSDINAKEFGRERANELTRNLGDVFEASEIIKYASDHNIKNLVFNHTEPLANLEYYLDIMELAKSNGLNIIWMSNGYFTTKSYNAVKKFLDFTYIDLKSFSRDAYRKHYKAELDIVLDNIRAFANDNMQFAITYSLIPAENDSEAELKKVCAYIFNLSSQIPLIFKKFNPEYRMQDKECTSTKKLIDSVEFAKKCGLQKVTFSM